MNPFFVVIVDKFFQACDLFQLHAGYAVLLGGLGRRLVLLGLQAGGGERPPGLAELGIVPEHAATVQGDREPGLGKLDAALKDNERAIALEPDSASYHAARAWTLRALERHDEALEFLGNHVDRYSGVARATLDSYWVMIADDHSSSGDTQPRSTTPTGGATGRTRSRRIPSESYSWWARWRGSSLMA